MTDKDNLPLTKGLSRLAAALSLTGGGCVVLYAVRVSFSGKTSYSFLLWNLFLAYVPFLVAVGGAWLLESLPRRARPAFLVLPVSLVWLLFYPNAPYIFTDFIHVMNKTYINTQSAEMLGKNGFLWYDLIMTAAFAFVGHFVGLISVWLVQRELERFWGTWPARLCTVAAIGLSGFGIYLGRFSRLNSWDLLVSPRKVAGAMRVIAGDPHAIVFSLAFSLVILLSYFALVVFKKTGQS